MPETTYPRHSGLLRVALITLIGIVLAAGSLTVARAATQSDAGTPNSAVQPAGTDSTRVGNVLTGPGIQATQALTVTKRDTLVGDADGDGQADTGDTLEYTIVITNDSGSTVTGVTLSDTIDAYTSLSGTVTVSPLAFDDSYDAIGNTRVSITPTLGLLANDVDIDDPAPPLNDGLSVVAVAGGTTAQGGDITLNADGSFTYNPPTSFVGTDSFDYTIEDGDGLRDRATITFTVAETVWYIDNTAPAGGDGRQATPFNSIAAFNSGASDSTGDIIFLYEGSGPYDGGFTLLDNQQLIGQGVDLAATTGLTPPLGTTLPAATANPVLDNSSGDAITLGFDSAIHGLTVGNTGGYAVTKSGYVGTAIINSVSITGTGGLLYIDAFGGGVLNATFDTLTTTGYSGDVVHLGSVNGSVTAAAGSITHAAAGDAVAILSGGVDVTLASSITKSGGGALLNVAGGHVGDLVFNGDVSASAGTGVQGNNADGTYTFNGDFDISGGTAGINLENGTDGSFAFLNSGASISGVNGVSVRVDGGGLLSLASVDYDGSIIHTAPTHRGIEITQSTGTISFDGPLQIGTSATPMTSAEAVFLSDTDSANAISFATLNIITGIGGGAGSRAFVSHTSGRVAVASGSINCNGNLGVDTYCVDVKDTTSDGVTFDSFLVDHDDAGETGGGIRLVNTPGAFTFGTFYRITGRNARGIYANNGGTLTIGNTTSGHVATSNRAAVDITNTALNITLTNVAAYGATDHAINLDGTSGTFNATGDVTANMAAGSNAAINVVNTAGGADIDIGTNSVTINDRRTTGVFVDNAQGTIDFGPTSIPNPTGAGGYGTRVEDTSADVTFAATDISDTTQTVARADGTNDGVADNSTYDGVGISLSNLSGSFTSNGGTIQNTADHGVDVLGATAGTVTLDGVTIQDPGVGASPPQTVASNAVSAYNLVGTLTVRNSTIHGFEHQTNSRGVRVLNVDQDFAGITIRSTHFSNDGGSLGGDDAVLVTGRGTVNGTIDVGDDNSVGAAGHRTVFENLSGEGVQVSMGNSTGAGTVDLTIENVDFRNAVNPGGFGGIDVSAVGTAVYDDIEIRGNSFANLYQADALGFGIIHLAPFGSSSMTAIIDGNDIDGSNVLLADEGRRGIYVATGDLAGETVQDLNLDINDNDINATAHEAIYIDVRGDALTSGGSGDVIITNNRIGMGTAVAQSEREAIEIRARDTFGGGGPKTVNLRVENNQVRNLDGSGGDETIDIDAEDSATLNATVLGNTFESVNGAADNEFEIATEDGGTTICLDLRNNVASQAGSAGSGSMLLDNSFGGTFSANYSGNTPTPATAGTIGSTAACTQPVVSLLGGDSYTASFSNDSAASKLVPVTDTNTERPLKYRSAVDHALADSIHTPVPQSAPPPAAHAVTTVDSNLAGADDAMMTSVHDASTALGQNRALGLAAPVAQPAPDVTVGPFDMPVGKAVTVTFQVVVDEPVPIGTTQVENQARVTADGVPETLSDDPDTRSDDDPTITQLDVETDLAITKTDNQTEVVPGEPITYTIVAMNNGPNPVGGATVTDNFSADLTGVTWTCDADAGNTCTSSGSGDISDAVTLTVGSSVTYTVNAIIDSAATGTLANTASIAAPAGINDDTSGNDSATDTDTLTPEVDIALVKTESADPVVAGAGNLTYVVTATNNGPSDASNVSVSEVITQPVGVSIDSITPSAGTFISPTWTIPDLDAGTSETLTIVLTVDANAAAGTDVVGDTATVTGADHTLINTGDDAVTELTSIAREVDLDVSVSESADPVTAGAGTGNLTYTVTVENFGPSDASGVALTDTLTLPADVPVDSVTPSGSTTWNGTSGTWIVGDLASGDSETLTLVLTVGPSANAGTDVIANEAAITAIDQTDANGANDSAIEATSIDTAADLVVTKVDTPDPVAAGEMLTYTVAITNNGPSDAQNVVATDTITDALTLDSTAGCAEDPSGAPTCSLGTIAAGSTAGYTITALVDSATLSDTITNTLAVTATTPDTAPGDESATITTTVDIVADLELTKIDTPDPVIAGQPLTYTLTITNHGPSKGWGVKVDDRLPLSYNHTGNSCGVSYSRPDPFEWVINNMPAGTVLTCVITGTVDPGVSGTITNTAFANTIAFVTDPDPSNDSLDEPTTVFDTLVDIGDATLAEGDAGTTAFTFTISRTNTTTTASVAYATGDDTATAGTDYTAISDTVNFAAGGSPTQTVTVDVSGDTLVELDETFFVTLSNPTNAGIGDGQGVGTIENDDGTALSVDDVTVNEPDGPAVFTVTLSATSALTTSMDYETNDGSAAGGADYTAVTGTLTIPAGTISDTISVPIIDDGTDEPLTETFTVDLSAPVNATLADDQGVGTIVDDDNTPPALSQVAITSPIDENDTVTMTGQISDPDVTDTFTLTVEWGDGSVITYTYGAGTTAFTETHRYLDDDPTGTPSDSYAVDLTLIDSEGANTIDTTSVTVDNLMPVVDAGSDRVATLNHPVALTGVFTDAGTLDTHTFEWDFGDGAMATGTLTPTHTYTAAGVYTAMLTVTDDDTGVGSDSIQVRVVPEATYLPLVIRPVGVPDLVVNDLIVTEDSIEVVIENQGTAAVTDEFWVDVYIDPEPAPSEVNQTWDMLADEGLVWGITSAALPLDPGETLTLTIGDAYYDATQSNFSGTLPASTPVYAQVDSANANTDYGGVLESHEISRGAYNNIAGPVLPSSARTFDIPRQRFGGIQSAEMPARPRP